MCDRVRKMTVIREGGTDKTKFVEREELKRWDITTDGTLQRKTVEREKKRSQRVLSGTVA